MCQKNRMINLILVAMLFVSSVTYAADYIWAHKDTEWYKWSDVSNWKYADADGTAAFEVPNGENDVIQDTDWGGEKSFFDLDGKSWTIGRFYDTKQATDAYGFTNGTLAVSLPGGESAFSKESKLDIYDASLIFNKDTVVNIGNNRADNNNTVKMLWSIHKGGLLEINGSAYFRHAKFVIDKDATFRWGNSAVALNANANVDWVVENSGTLDWPNGFRSYYRAWSFRPVIRQYHGGKWILGDSLKYNENIFFRIELHGGTVVATNNVTFELQNSERGAYAKFMPEADIMLSVAENCRLDMATSTTTKVPFLYEKDENGENHTKITYSGGGELALIDVPYSLDYQGGRIEFANNTRTSMGSLKIGSGCSFSVANANMTLETLEDNAGAITIEKPGLSIAALGEGATLSGTFAFETAAFSEGDTLVSTPNAQLRAKIKSDAAEAFRSFGVTIIEEGESLIVGDSTFVFNSTTITDLNNAEGWPNGIPAEGCDVTIAGVGVNAVISESLTTSWGSITVQDGATLHVASSDVSLSEIVLKGKSTLKVESDLNLSEIVTMAIGEEELPTIIVAGNVTLTIPAGYKFKNVHLVLCEGATLTESGDGPIVFGYADSNETTYFAMHATNATITALNSANTANTLNASQISFVSPAVGGVVNVIGDIVLKDCKITYNQYDGFQFGVNNPVSKTFRVVADRTNLEFGADTVLSGAANLCLTNDACLYRKRRRTNNHDSESENIYNLTIREKAKITLVAGGEIRASITDKSNETKGVIQLEPDEDGTVGIEILEGGVGCWYKVYGNGKGVIRYAGGLQRVFCSLWWSWGNRARIYNKLKSVDVAQDSQMVLCGNDDIFGDNSHRLTPLAIESLFSGSGNVVITNACNGKEFGPVLVRGDNTCTGTLLAVDGVGKAIINVLDGANWAGTVVANGKVRLVNQDSGNLFETLPVAVTFGALDLQADFPVRVWRGEDGALTNDTLNVGTYLKSGGKLVPTMMTEGGEFVSNDKIVVGRIAKDAVLPDVPKNWVAITKNIDDDNENDLLILKQRKGFMIRVR